LNSPSLANIRISGVYSSADPASLILFLRNQSDLIVSERGNEIRINPKKD
jgi:ferric-dicitrate binding protein FerR (iron transport regulator)